MEKRKMTKLPEKELLSGMKTPRTTTGEMKDALGKVRDYLNELLGEDSTDKEAARLSLGIDLAGLAAKIETKADRQALQEAIKDKADKIEVENRANGLEEAIAKKGVPVGTIGYFAMATPPAGYLKADGAEVGRETCPDLFSAIGTTFGEGDGETTFNLPDLINRFAQGSTTPGKKVEAGLPNITGSFVPWAFRSGAAPDGAISRTGTNYESYNVAGTQTGSKYYLDASRSNPTYGASDTVQPPALTLLPCIKAFDAATNPGLIDMTKLANDVADLSANKLDKTIDGTAVKYVTETYNDGTNWYRKWSDGWLEQGCSGISISQSQMTITLPAPFESTAYTLVTEVSQMGATSYGEGVSVQTRTASSFTCHGYHSSGLKTVPAMWYACGKGAQS